MLFRDRGVLTGLRGSSVRRGFMTRLGSVRGLRKRSGIETMGAEMGRSMFHSVVLSGCLKGYTLAKVSIPRLLITDRVGP